MLLLLTIFIMGSNYFNKNVENKSNNTTVENISVNNTNITQNDSNNSSINDSKNSQKSIQSSTKKSSTSKQSSRASGEGSSILDSKGNTLAPPDDSGNWVVMNGKYKRAVTYKNGHYYDYHGDNVDHKMK